jgi:hypothetical protein
MYQKVDRLPANGLSIWRHPASSIEQKNTPPFPAGRRVVDVKKSEKRGVLLDLLTFLAQTLDLNGDKGRPEFVLLAQTAQTLVKISVPELDDLSGGGADHVMVTSARLHLLVEVVFAAEAAFANQAALNQQIEGAINRRTRHLALLGLHPRQKVIRVEMFVGGEDLVQQGEPFLGDLEVVFPQILDK